MDKKLIYKNIGKNIAEIRRQKGYTQESFAELMDKSWSSVAKLETGCQNISIGKLIEIAEYLNVDFKEFLK
ncbi:helix-turn-helix transcriptional regulator [bacterium]|nr:helix-turn-helix transcriptional regulator [bacterium]